MTDVNPTVVGTLSWNEYYQKLFILDYMEVCSLSTRYLVQIRSLT